MEDKSLFYAQGLSELIKMKTVSKYYETDFTRFYEFHEVLKKLFPTLFSTVEVNLYGGSLLLKWKGLSSEKPVLFMHHHDVVEAEGDWKYPPFSGEIAEGKVWGRGAVDTKSGLYCMLQAGEELVKSGFVPKNDIYFESACTEEVEGSGADVISQELEKKGIRFFYTIDEGGVIITDPLGMSDKDYAMVAVGEKACNVIKFTAKSHGGHASAPTKDTPLVRLGKFMAEVDSSNIFKAKINPTVVEMLKRFSLNAKGGLKFILKHGNAFKPILKVALPKISATANAFTKTTIAFTMAGGSESDNSIPQEAWVMGNMRVAHHQSNDDAINAVKKIADKYDIITEVKDRAFESKISDYKSEPFRLIEQAIARFYDGVTVTPFVSNTASDSRYMSRVSDVCLGFAPFKISDEQYDGIHGVNESIDIECLSKGVEFYKFLMEKV